MRRGASVRPWNAMKITEENYEHIRPETSSCSAKLFAFAGSSGIYKNQGGESEIAAIYASCRGIKLDDREVFKGVCKSLDGVSLFAITPTGSGKTSYYILHILIILEIIKDPDLCPSADFPKNPVLLVICPTIPLQIEMASNMTKLGLKAMAINSETKTVAQQEDKDLWRLARTEPNVVLTGPEQLKTADFEKAIRDTTFYERICGTGFDEVHLLNTWGSTFRKEFQQMGFLRARLTDHHNPWILTSATVRDGAPFDSICCLLGLRPDNFHLIRRSCARPDVQILFRDLTSPINGESFPELDWILDDNRPTVVYPKTYSRVKKVTCTVQNSSQQDLVTRCLVHPLSSSHS
ncbi:hypothetical protein B0H14DRAFT_2640630 [Mycena olivaceomarginata]|nr:hypothetical protein B0H14DRAFT_2640630 [Mycena olivaceomarginata]